MTEEQHCELRLPFGRSTKGGEYDLQVTYTRGYNRTTYRAVKMFPDVRYKADCLCLYFTLSGASGGLYEAYTKLRNKIGDKADQIKIPTLEEHNMEMGYYRTSQFGLTFQWKQYDNIHYLTSIYKMDELGFVYLDEPKNISEYPEFEKLSVEGDNPRTKGRYGGISFLKKVEALAKDGEEIYYWDDIGIMCGSAGLGIVKDGKLIKRLTTAMA